MIKLTRYITMIVSLSFCLQSFGQVSKSDLKKIDKLKNKYDFVSLKNRYFKVPNTCSMILVGDYIKGPSDGGGGANKEIRNIKKVDLKGNILENISEYSITLPFSTNHSNYSHIARIKGTNGNIGLMDVCGSIISEPTYDHINALNEQGLAVAFKGNTIDVVNHKGVIVNQTPLKYKVDYNSFWTIPSPGAINDLKVFDNKVIASFDEATYGLFDLSENKALTDFKYDYINPRLLKNKDQFYYEASLNGQRLLLHANNGLEVIPPVFKNIKSITGAQDNLEINGETDAGANIYQVATKKFLFPLDLTILSYQEIYDKEDLWTLNLAENEKSLTGIYNSSTQEFIMEPNTEIKTISVRGNYFNSVSVVTNDGQEKIYDFDKREILDIKLKTKNAKSIKTITLEGDEEPTFLKCFIRPLKNGSQDYYLVYDKNWNLILKTPSIRGVKTTKDYFYFFVYNENREKEYTAVDRQGKVIKDFVLP